MERSSFFNSINGDRKYKAEEYARYFSSFIGNGVFPNPSTNLQVISNNDMTVTLKAGKAWINGYFYENTDDLILQVDPADGVLSRVDRIVLRLDFLDREIKAKIKKGAFASNPVVPTLQRDADAYELGIADIKINKGTISITQANITDLRLNSTFCGVVHGVVEQVDVTTLFNQYSARFEQKEIDFESEFNTWFDDIKNRLGEDVAGNLLNQINDLAGEGRTTETVKSAYDLAQQAFQSASDGKILVASAITGKGVPASGSDTFPTLANKIGGIETDKTGDATATAADIILNKSAYAKSAKLIGTLTLSGNAIDADVLATKDYYNTDAKVKRTGTMPNIGKQIGTITTKGGQLFISKGYHDGTGFIKYDDPNHIPSNIMKDITVGGVKGTGVGKYATGTVTPTTTDGGSTYTFSVTGLTFMPRVIIGTTGGANPFSFLGASAMGYCLVHCIGTYKEYFYCMSGAGDFTLSAGGFWFRTLSSYSSLSGKTFTYYAFE